MNAEARHPTQLYEAFLEGIVLFGILWWMFWKTDARYQPGKLSTDPLQYMVDVQAMMASTMSQSNSSPTPAKSPPRRQSSTGTPARAAWMAW